MVGRGGVEPPFLDFQSSTPTAYVIFPCVKIFNRNLVAAICIKNEVIVCKCRHEVPTWITTDDSGCLAGTILLGATSSYLATILVDQVGLEPTKR